MKKSYIIAAGILIASVVWMASGMIGPKDTEKPAEIVVEETEKDAVAKAQEELANAMRNVQIKTSIAQDYTQVVTLNGQTEAQRMVEIKAEINGNIEKVLIEEGNKVNKGDIIAQIETNDLYAMLQVAREQLKQREIEYRAAENLANKGFNSKIRLATAKAELESARANLKRAEIDFANTKVRAPFSGVLETRPVELGTYVQNGDPMATIVDLDPMYVVVSVSENRIHGVKKGSQAVVSFPDGRKFDGHIRYIASSSDPSTRTFRVEVEVPNPESEIIDGLTASVDLSGATVKAHHVSPAFLSLDDNGVVGVKVLDDENVVRFAPLKILADTDKNMWITGLGDQARIITIGHQFVAAGQKIDNAVEQETAE